MTTLEKLEKVCRDQMAPLHDFGDSVFIEVSLSGNGETVGVYIYRTFRDVEDAARAQRGRGPTVEAALVDLLANMGAL